MTSGDFNRNINLEILLYAGIVLYLIYFVLS